MAAANAAAPDLRADRNIAQFQLRDAVVVAPRRLRWIRAGEVAILAERIEHAFACKEREHAHRVAGGNDGFEFGGNGLRLRAADLIDRYALSFNRVLRGAIREKGLLVIIGEDDLSQQRERVG